MTDIPPSSFNSNCSSASSSSSTNGGMPGMTSGPHVVVSSISRQGGEDVDDDGDAEQTHTSSKGRKKYKLKLKKLKYKKKKKKKKKSKDKKEKRGELSTVGERDEEYDDSGGSPQHSPREGVDGANQEQKVGPPRRMHSSSSPDFALRRKIHLKSSVLPTPRSLTCAYRDYESRALATFTEIHMRAADLASEDDDDDTQFQAILRAANVLLASEVVECGDDSLDAHHLVERQSAPDGSALIPRFQHMHAKHSPTISSANTKGSSDGAGTGGKEQEQPRSITSRHDACSPCVVTLRMIWNLAVANVCCNQLLQEIGGAEGNDLVDLTVTQLLDLVSWIDYFVEEHIKPSFPRKPGVGSTDPHAAEGWTCTSATGILVKAKSKEEEEEDRRDDAPLPSMSASLAGGLPHFVDDKFKAYNRELCPDLTTEMLTIESITVNLSWVRAALREAQRLAQEEYLQRTRDQAEQLLDKVYTTKRSPTQLTDGTLTLSLGEDIYSFVSIQFRTSQAHLMTESSSSSSHEALILTVSLMLSQLRRKHIQHRSAFLQQADIEWTCSVANDFHRMCSKLEEVFVDLCVECSFPAEIRLSLEQSALDLVELYSSDAVHAVQSLHGYIIDPLMAADIHTKLFGKKWAKEYTYNELAMSIVRTIEDFHRDLTVYLGDDILQRKLLHCMVSSTAVFYVKCLLEKAEEHPNNRVGYFDNVPQALTRMGGDIAVLRQFFEGHLHRVPSLEETIEDEFMFLTVMHECLTTAAASAPLTPRSKKKKHLSSQEEQTAEEDFVLVKDDVADFVIVVHKLLGGKRALTQRFLGDLWHLVNPTQERAVWDLVESMREQLDAVFCTPDDGHLESPRTWRTTRAYQHHHGSSIMPSSSDDGGLPIPHGLRMDQMLISLYRESRRRRPLHQSAIDKMVDSLHLDWVSEMNENHHHHRHYRHSPKGSDTHSALERLVADWKPFDDGSRKHRLKRFKERVSRMTKDE